MQFKESSTLELKQIIVQDIKKEVIAFANTKGGIIYVGIADDGSIIGLEDPDQAILQASSMIHDAIKPDLTMFVDLDLEYIDKKTILKITVQKGTHAPYYLQSKGIRPEGVYIRKGAAAIPASEDAIRAMIKENDGDRFESRRSLRQDLTFTALKNFFDKKNLKLEEQQFMTLGLMKVFIPIWHCCFQMNASTVSRPLSSLAQRKPTRFKTDVNSTVLLSINYRILTKSCSNTIN